MSDRTVPATPTHAWPNGEPAPASAEDLGVLIQVRADPTEAREWAAIADNEIDAAMHGLLQLLLDRGGRRRLREALARGDVPSLAIRAFTAH
jgi:hypothetical protein